MAMTQTLAEASPAGTVLRAALDSGRVRDAVRRHGWQGVLEGGELVGCTTQRLHFSGRNGSVVEYVMQVRRDGRSIDLPVFGQVAGGDVAGLRSAALKRLSERSRHFGVSETPTDAFCMLPELGLLLRPRGIDERIDGLWLMDGAAEAARMTTVGKCDGIALLAHRLGKRAVLAADLHAGRDTSERVIVKLYKRVAKTVQPLVEVMRNLAAGDFSSSSPISISGVIKVLPHINAVMMERAPGALLGDLTGEASVHGHEMAGRAIALLHAQTIEAEHYLADDERTLLAGLVDRVSCVIPDVADVLRTSLAVVADRIPACRELRPIHRDFHEKQLLVDGGRACMIDFDTLRLGDPAQDLGNFIAHLRLRELHTASPRDGERIAFLRGYEDFRPLPPEAAISAHCNATLLRLACISMFSDRARHLVPELLRDIASEPVRRGMSAITKVGAGPC